MRSGLIFLVLAAQVLAGTAFAGPWMREKGTTFTATSYTTNYFRDTGNSFYMEMGVREDLTFGADIGHYVSRTGYQSGSATLFLRRRLGSHNRNSKWAYEVGIGTAWQNTLFSPHLKTALLWGRGIKLRDHSGWFVVDTTVIWSLGSASHIIKLDTTLGLNFNDVTSGMLQLYLSQIGKETYATFAPSLLLKRRGGKFRYQVGLESPIGNLKDTSIKFGIWREF